MIFYLYGNTNFNCWRVRYNCYILKKGEAVIIIDPGADFENIKKKIGKSKVVGVLVTHGCINLCI